MARFEVSTAGMRKLQAGRPAAHLAKELISNALDERSVNKIVVSIRKIDTRNALFEVEDDGEGFADITHAWTLYAPTVKQRDATVRGRFNLGEKEILSVARRGFIHTTSGRVEFDGDARKFSAKNKRERGTVVSLEMPWTKEQCAEVEEFFKTHPAPSAARAIQQALERIRLNAKWLERNRQDLAAWFSARSAMKTPPQ